MEKAMSDWEQRYQDNETGWDRGEASSSLHAWLEHGELEPCRILVPGCGRGHEAVELAKRGFAVTAIDIAPSACSYLEQELKQAGVQGEVICGDLFAFNPPSPVDAVYEQTCLCAIDPEQRAAYEMQLHRWLKPGGKLCALFMQTGAEGGPPFHCDLLTMHRLFDEQRWQWPQNEPLFSPHSNGRFELGYALIRQ
jgi:SAM-dependent methyltransferase